MEFECCFSFVKEYNIEVESTIRPILYPSRPIKLQRFCLAIMINILFILYNFQKTLKTIKRYKCNLEHYRLSCILLRSIWEYVTSLCKDYNCSVLRINLWSSRPEFSVKMVFLKISRNSQFCVGFSFLIKLQAPATLLKKTIRRGCFCEFREIFKNTCNFIKKENPTQAIFVNFAKFSRTPFLQNTSEGDCFCNL